jgi:hypothetical protein
LKDDCFDALEELIVVFYTFQWLHLSTERSDSIRWCGVDI